MSIAPQLPGRPHERPHVLPEPAGAPPAAPCYAPLVEWDPHVQRYMEAVFGVETFGRMCGALAMPPLSTCLRVNTLRTTPESVAERLPSALSPGDRAMLQSIGSRPSPSLHVPGAVIVPGSGPHQVDYALAEGREVIISRWAGEAVLRGAPVFVPGVLAATAGIAEGDLVAVTVAVELPGSDWCGISRGALVGADTGADRSKLHIGLGRAALSRADMFRRKGGVAVAFQQRAFSNPSCNGVLEGEVMLQSMASFTAALVLSPTPGSRVLDMCAAPGGKTTALAQIMGDSGEVIALDRSHSKVASIWCMAAEFGLTCISAHKMDATQALLPPTSPAPAPSAGPYPLPEAAPLPEHADTSQARSPAGGEAVWRGPDPRAAAKGPRCGDVRESAGHLGSTSNDLTEMVDDPGRASTCRAMDGEGDAVGAHSGVADELEDEGGCANGAAAASGLGPFSGLRGRQLNEKEQRRQQRRLKAMLARGMDPLQEATPQQPLLPPQLDQCQRPDHISTSVQWCSCRGFPPESFDYIMLDAPCTGLGLRPRLLQRQSIEQLRSAAHYQRKLLDVALALLKPGGEMVYSTCSINPGENEVNVRYALDSNPCLELLPQLPHIGGRGVEGPCEPAAQQDCGDTCGESVPAVGVMATQPGARPAEVAPQPRPGEVLVTGRPGLSAAEAFLVQRFDPAGPHQTIGFFIARFRKRSPHEVLVS